MNPFIISWKAKYAIIDYRANEQIFKTIERHNLIPIKTIKCDDILEPVCGHPDMVMHPIDNTSIVVAPNVFDYYYSIFKNSGINLIKGGKTLSRNYPHDIAYNVARMSNYAIHNLKYTDEVLKYYLHKSDISFIHVNQGYSKCSTASISDDKAISSDFTICTAIRSLGLECLYFNPKNICLEGYEYGFAGGCMGRLDNKHFLLTGNIADETSKNDLYSSIEREGLNIIEASDAALTDYGTIIVI